MNSFDKFIEKEKEYSKMFFNKFNIIEDRFNELDYCIIKILWNDEILINKIYNVIDNLIKKEKLQYELRYLIIGDFLFSLNSNELSNPTEIIFKVLRSDYIFRIQFRNLINIYLNFNYKDYVTIHKKLLIGLRIEKIILKTELRNKEKNRWKTIINFQLSIKNFSTKITLWMSKYSFLIIKINDFNYSLSSFRYIIKIKRKKKEMRDFLIPFDGIKKSNNISFILSKNLFFLNQNLINNSLKNYLIDVSCTSLDNYFDKIKTIFKDDKIVKNVVECEIFQKLLVFKILEMNIWDIVFYLPSILDNRGRQYYCSLLSPTFNKIFRNLYTFATKKSTKNLITSEYYKKLIQFKWLIRNWNFNDYDSYFILVLLIEIGKHFIKNDQYFVKTEEILKKGILCFENKTTISDLCDQMYLNKIYYYLNKILKERRVDEDCLNIIIYRDATASGLQNYGILLGYKKNQLKYLNIDGDSWCDTYKFIIDKYLLKTEHNQRYLWKYLIMTVQYNATWYTCFLKTLEILKKKNIEYKNWTRDEQITFKTIHKDFYEKIKNNLKNDFYENKFQTIHEFKYDIWLIVNKYEYKVNFNNGRDKYENILFMLIDDHVLTERAQAANNLHFLDGSIVRDLLKNFELIVIHDCFGIRLNEVHLVMDELNKFYSKKIGEKTYSLYIIL